MFEKKIENVIYFVKKSEHVISFVSASEHVLSLESASKSDLLEKNIENVISFESEFENVICLKKFENVTYKHFFEKHHMQTINDFPKKKTPKNFTFFLTCEQNDTFLYTKFVKKTSQFELFKQNNSHFQIT